MNKAKHTARKRMNLLRKGAEQGPKTLLGRWALRIWQQGTGFHLKEAIAAAAAKAAQ